MEMDIVIKTGATHLPSPVSVAIHNLSSTTRLHHLPFRQMQLGHLVIKREGESERNLNLSNAAIQTSRALLFSSWK